MTTQEPLLSTRPRSQPIAFPQPLSAAEMGRDGTLSPSAIAESAKYRPSFRLFLAMQLCAGRLSGHFLTHVHERSPHIISDVGPQLALPPSLAVEVPARKAT